LLDELRAESGIGVVMLVGRADVSVAIRAVKRGAIDFLEKPIDLERLEIVVGRTAEIVRLRGDRTAPPHAAPIVRERPGTLADIERDAIRAALTATNGNKVRTARMLGIARSTLLEKLKRIPD
jgi:DNA-binding NtrC family response regulator